MSGNEYDIRKIEAMAERAKLNEPHDAKRTTESGAVEYSFSEGLPKTSLVFLDGEEQDNASVEAKEPDGDVSVTVAVDETAAEESGETRLRTPDEEEFNIPDMFVISDEYSQADASDMAPMIWRTYVPRFTEITERPIKMRSDSGSVSGKEPTVQTSPIRVDRVVGGEGADPALSEKGQSSGAVVVNVDGGGSVITGADRLNLYKFGGEQRPPEIVLSEEEAAKREVTELTGHVFVDEPQETPEQSAVNEPVETQAQSETYSSPKRDETSAAKDTNTLNEAYIAPDPDELPPEERPLGWDTDLSKISVKGKQDYVDHSQRESFKDRFLDFGLAVKIRLVIAAVVALAALFFEGASLFGVKILELMSIENYPAVYPLIDGLLVVAMLLVAFPETLRALRALAFGKVIPELMLTVCAISLIAYNTVIAAKLPVDYPSFAFAYGIIAVSAIYATYCLHKSNFDAFKIVSARGNKTVIDIRLTRNFEMENVTLDGRVDEFKSRLGRSFKCAFASDFDKRSRECDESHSNNLVILLLTLGIALVSGLVMYFIQDGAVSLLATFSLVVMLGAPAFSVLSHKLPFSYMESEATGEGYALIGEQSAKELSQVDCFAFTDGEVFSADDVSLKSISLSDIKGDLRSAMRMLSSLFASLGGPLEELFYRSLGKRFPAATNMTIEKDGASGTVGGSAVMAGTREYMERHGVTVAPERESFLGGMRIMYAAEDGMLFAKINVQYNFSEEFARALAYMKAHGVTPLVYSRDPNVDNELLRFLTGGADVIRAMKRTTPCPERETVYRRLSSPAVSRGGKGDMLEAVFLAKRYKLLQSHLSVTELSASAVGASLAAVIAVSGLTAGLPTLLVGVWQMLWCVAVGIISARSFKKIKGKKLKKDE